MTHDEIPNSHIKKSTISPLWLFTLVALALAAWLGYRSFSQTGERITIQLKDAQGIEVNRTAIRYQGLDVGVIRKVTLDDSLAGVIAEADIFPQATHLLHSDSMFWVVRPKASITGISGLDTLVSGNYLVLKPGESKQMSSAFVAMAEAPNAEPEQDNLFLYLSSDDLRSLNIGSGVYYKKIQVGEIFNYELSDDKQHVLLSVQIQKKYADLVKSTSRFWNVSGVKAHLGLGGINVDIENLASIIAGGVTFDSPAEGDSIENKTKFALYSSINEAERGIAITLDLPKNHGIKDNHAAILYQGLEIGRLSGITQDKKSNSTTATANIDPSMSWLLKHDSQFTIEEPVLSLAGVKNISNIFLGNTLSIEPGEGEPSNYFKAKTKKQQFADDPSALKLRLTAEDLSGLSENTQIVYRGVDVGFVYETSLDVNQLFIDVIIYPQYRHLVKSDSRFFRSGGISGKISSEGVEFNMPAAAQLVQSAISFTSSGSAKLANKYHLFDSETQAKQANSAKPGYKQIELIAQSLPSISEGSPVLYKNVTVGKVSQFFLEKDHLRIKLLIENRYAHLLTSQTVFWDQSGIDIRASLAGVNIQTSSLKSIVIGGISFGNIAGVTNKKNGNWILYNSLTDAQNQGLAINFTAEHANGLSVGSDIRFQGIKVGEVTALSPAFNRAGVIIDAKIYSQFANNIAKKSSYFWLTTPTLSLTQSKNLDSLLGAYISVTPGKGELRSKFTLYNSEEFSNGLALVLESEARNSISVGTPILFRDFEVGVVTKTSLGKFADRVLIDIKISDKYKHLVRENTVFWNQSGVNVKLGLSGADVKTGTVDSIIRGGIAFATPETPSLQPKARSQQHFLLHNEPKPEWSKWRTAIANF
ncbi:MAG: MlaD family protein [Enterovibrio sp.]